MKTTKTITRTSVLVTAESLAQLDKQFRARGWQVWRFGRCWGILMARKQTGTTTRFFNALGLGDRSYIGGEIHEQA